ncbi:hypothetical protein [Sphingomonas sp. G-3-2-10]|uniref:hypothetical protein n=1 Tax=Sphingomonas sp. G-3-2-10 TaxID=2728838 RepID=UPI00146C7573|nr:hypothetical protein [Sphingomonas sp. G-3-2-10]NML04286.1 hypothetical protein [Sphingomonas sp. G-3-2-10]
MGNEAPEAWQIDCPKCATHVDQNSITCANCDSRAVRMTVTFINAAHVRFNCTVCQAPQPGICCPNCGIGLNAILDAKYEKRPHPDQRTFLILFALLFAGWIASVIFL